MNRKTTFLLFGVLLSGLRIFAQTTDFGISVGYGSYQLRWPAHTALARGVFTFKSSFSYGAEINWAPHDAWGGGIGLLSMGARAASDSVDVQPRFKYYYSEIDIRYAALYVPIKVLYRIPIKKWMLKFSFALMPGFKYKGSVAEKQIPTSPLYNPIDFYLEYDGFELGIMGEVRFAYEITPGLHLGANARYFKSDVDMDGFTSSGSSSSIDQFSTATYLALSANWRMGR